MYFLDSSSGNTVLVSSVIPYMVCHDHGGNNVKHIMASAVVNLKIKYMVPGLVDRLSEQTVSDSLGTGLVGQPQCSLERSVLKFESPTG